MSDQLKATLTEVVLDAMTDVYNAGLSGIEEYAEATVDSILVHIREGGGVAVYWCKEHGVTGSNDYCWQGSVRGDSGFCKMVPARIVVTKDSP